MLLRNARLVLPEKTTELASILIEDQRIRRVFDSSETLPGSPAVIDLAGLTLFPGFIDLHIHGATGVDTMDATDDDLLKLATFLSRNGVTAWLPTLVPATSEQYVQAANSIDRLMRRQSADQEGGARALGIHYEGPFVNDEQCGALHRKYFRTFKQMSELASLPRLKHTEAAHMMTVAPEIEGGIALIKELASQSWIVSIGHTRANVEVLDQAFAAGARHMTHFMNAMAPLHHRAPGAIGWGLMNDQVTCDLIADGIHLASSILKLVLRNKTSERVSLISDAIAAAGLNDGQYEIWGETIVVKDGRTQNSQGSIAGSVITMLDAVRMMLSLGFGESKVAQMAALNPARLLKLDYECGSIEAGKRADLVALDEQRKVRLTIIGGQISFQDLAS
ncbi:MAG: N-acetylglucosamine-6-phosphate deacetylase [Pyrinomonadaceae bacterium]